MPYKDDSSAREWERGYRRGWKDSRLKYRAWCILTILGAPALIVSAMLGFEMGRHAWVQDYAKKDPVPSLVAGQLVQSNLSGVEDRLDRLNTTIEKSCQSQPVTVVTPSEVREAVTAEQTPKLSLAIGKIITGAVDAGTGVIKDTQKFKEKIVNAAIDSTTKIADSTAEALIKRFIAKEGEKTLPENIQITVTQNNAATPTVRVPVRPTSQTSVCTTEKK